MTLDELLEKNKDQLSAHLPRGYLSVSQISQALRCWRQYEFRVVKGLVLPPSVALSEGKAIHQAVEIGHREAVKTDKVPIDLMLDTFQKAWQESVPETDWDTDEEQIGPKGIEIRGQTLIRIYHEQQLPKIKTVVENDEPQVEFPFLIKLRDIPIVGIIDLIGIIENKKSVIDHKVVARKRTKDSITSDIQLSLYSLVTQIRNVGFNCIVKTKNTVEFIGDELPEQLDWLEDLVERVAGVIRSGVFPPCSPEAWWCNPKYCGYYKLCRTR